MVTGPEKSTPESNLPHEAKLVQLEKEIMEEDEAMLVGNESKES